VRKAFTADIHSDPSKTLIVADYGQLELRLLAHMANCRSMINAFELGGDFHSRWAGHGRGLGCAYSVQCARIAFGSRTNQPPPAPHTPNPQTQPQNQPMHPQRTPNAPPRTALGMYDHIKEAIDKGDCLLEWDGGPNHEPSPVPLLKDKFASERRKAKVLNFSIAYGKTAHGLSKDWGVSIKEAEETLKRWYADRPEVRLVVGVEWLGKARGGFAAVFVADERS